MPEPAHGPTTGAAAAVPAAPRPTRVEYVLLTADDELLEQIALSLDGESTVRHADTIDAAREQIRPMRPCVVILDARGHADLGQAVAQLQSADGTSLVVVLAPAADAQDVARAVKGAATFAVLPIPIEPGQTGAVLHGAREEALGRLALLSAPAARSQAGASPVVAPEDRSATLPQRPGRSQSAARTALNRAPARQPDASGPDDGSPARLRIIAVAAVLLVGLVVAWFALHRSPQKTPAVATIPAAPPTAPPAVDETAPPATESLQDGAVDDLLDKARVAFRARRYAEPDGDNALLYYRSALAKEPGNGEAREGLERIGAVLKDRVQSLLDERQADAAARALAELKLAAPDEPAVTGFATKLAGLQISAALDSGNADRAGQLLRQATQSGAIPPQDATHWREEIARHQGEARAQQLAALVTTRIRDGKLVDPANDSAKAYLMQLRRMPSVPNGLADEATGAVQQALLQKVRDATAQAQRTDADRWAAEARALGVPQAKITAAQRDGAAMAQAKQASAEAARLAQLVQSRIAEGRLTEPAQDSALYYLNALRTADPSSDVWATGARALSGKLVERGRAALANGKLDAAQASAAAARQLGVGLSDVDGLDQAIAAARASGGNGEPRQVAASEFKRTRYVEPRYPQDALDRGIKGEVRVKLTVDTEGKVKEVLIVNSTPAGVFDAAAQEAVRQWRFKPIRIDGKAVEASATTTLIFQPGNGG